MSEIFGNLPYEKAIQLDSLSRLAFAAREARAGLLAFHGVDGEDALRDRIVAGAVDEHPAWEHCVAARVLELTREAAREAMRGYDAPQGELPHLRIRAMLDDEFSGALAAPVGATLDALEVRLANGVVLTLHAASPEQYSFSWHGGDPSRRAILDTAPCHRAIAGHPAHLHHADGRVLADPVTRAGVDPVDNVRALVSELLANPRLALED